MIALTDLPSTATTAIDGDARHEVDIGYERSPIDVLPALIFAAVAITLALITRWATDAVVDLEGDLIGALDVVSPPVQRIISGALQVFVGLLTLFFIVFPIVTRRYRLLGYVVTVHVLAAGLVLLFVWWLDRARPTLLETEILRRGGFGHDYPTSWAIGGLVGTFGVLSPFVTTRYRRAGAISLGVIVVGRLIISEHLPAEIFVAIALGATASAIVLFAYGRPGHHPTPTGHRRRAPGERRPAGAPDTGRRRRPGVGPVRRRRRRRHADLRQGARSPPALGRPAVPHVPGHPPEERRRRATVLVAPSAGRARGARGPVRPRRRGAGAPAPGGRRGRHRLDAPGLRPDRRTSRRPPRTGHGRRRPARSHLGPGGGPAPPPDRPPRPPARQPPRRR